MSHLLPLDGRDHAETQLLRGTPEAHLLRARDGYLAPGMCLTGLILAREVARPDRSAKTKICSQSLESSLRVGSEESTQRPEVQQHQCQITKIHLARTVEIGDTSGA